MERGVGPLLQAAAGSKSGCGCKLKERRRLVKPLTLTVCCATCEEDALVCSGDNKQSVSVRTAGV